MAGAKCTKSIVEVNSMLQNNDIKDIKLVKPIPLPRQNLPKQATIQLDHTENTFLKKQGKSAQDKRSKKSSYYSARKPGSLVTSMVSSLQENGLNIKL